MPRIFPRGCGIKQTPLPPPLHIIIIGDRPLAFSRFSNKLRDDLSKGMRDMRALYTIVCISIVIAGAAGCGTVAKQVVLRNPKVEHILDHPRMDRTVTHPGYVEIIGDEDNRITVLYVNGSPYEMGYEHGRLLRADVRGTVRDGQA